MRSIKHIIWDWNGTLFGDSRTLIEATISAFAAAGFPPPTPELYQRHHTQPIPLFYNRLAGRELTDSEQRLLDLYFQESYARYRDEIMLNRLALEALDRWSLSGGTQSLLSMHPQERLLPLVRKAGIFERFTVVDGLVEGEPGRKAPHLELHLRRLPFDRREVLLIGDSVDDGLAARECGTACLMYHAGPDALHDLEHFSDLPFPVVGSLLEAVDLVLTASR
ncbi:HAD family hydrolase [Nonomuraea cavernae]|uniref:HAD family hydrolase n=1 Tax=Nonomuraea cavernae TaxID=2045107 RepID=UPI0034018C6F